ncbi:MAG TPA: serine/threonine-protein kinase, partial [Ktedonobacteraceae bacterium]|nr:serine/threonine-protein kinase [Ktedonobacteraceae bacterium]
MDPVEHLLKREQPLGHYKLMRLLGRGGFADVYLGEHIHLNTQAAVKILHTRLAEEDIQAFKGEAQMVARLMHPHIVRVLDFGVEEMVPYLVMDYAPDGTLRNAFKKGQRVPLPTVLSWIKQAAEALQYAHDQRVIHRDVKPENMLVGRNREILLSDFGIALVQQSSRVQSTQNIAGTIAYMAPEQISAHPRPASDQYSLGIVAYEWLCGVRPFQGSYTEIAVKQSMVPPPPFQTYVPDIPPGVEQVIFHALQKDPGQRFPDIRSFVRALEQSALHPEAFSTRVSTQISPPQPVPSSMPSPGQQPAPPVLTPPPSNATGQSSLSTSPVLYPPPPPGQSPYPYIQQPLPPYAYPHGYREQQPSGVSLTPPVYGQMVNPPAGQRGRHTTRRAFLIAGSTLGVLAAGGVAAAVFLAQHNPLQQALNTIQQHTNSAGAGVELTYSHFEDLVWIVRWSGDGKLIASGCFDGTMQIWTADKGETRLTVRSSVQPRQSDDYPWSITWSPRTGEKVAVSFVDGNIQILDMSTGSKLATPPKDTLPVAVPVLAWSSDDKHLAVGGGDGHVRIYEYTDSSWKLVRTYQEHTNSINVL